MGTPEAKAFLKGYQRTLERRRQITEIMDILKTRAESTTAQITGMPRASGNGDKVGSGGASIADLRRELETLDAESVARLAEITRVINAVEDAEQSAILSRYYVEGQTLLEIAYTMNYSYRWITELHGRALESVSKIISRV